MDFIKNTFFSGLKLILPLFLLIYVFQNIYDLILKFLNPIVSILPRIPYFGHELLDLRAFITFLVFIFLIGLLMYAGFGKFIAKIMAGIFLKLIPGSPILNYILHERSGDLKEENDKVVVINIDDGWVFGIIIEDENEDGFIMVYVPGAPIPTGGTFYMMTEDKIKRVNISVEKALTCIWHLGKNSEKILKGKLPSHPAAEKN
ncbi:MAG: DUF502 domain-containing protein [Ignavibacteriae bacterium]|nr:DUF502 domain-containing protein [Ignavibacteriota bacterium]